MGGMFIQRLKEKLRGNNCGKAGYFSFLIWYAERMSLLRESQLHRTILKKDQEITRLKGKLRSLDTKYTLIQKNKKLEEKYQSLLRKYQKELVKNAVLERLNGELVDKTSHFFAQE